MQGRSGVGLRPDFEETDFALKIAAKINDFDARKFIKPRKAIKIMCKPIQFGCAAASMAVEQAGLDDGATDPDRIGTLFGTETFFADPNEVANVFHHCTIDEDYQHDKWGEFAMRKIQPLWMLKYLPNMAASHISIAIDARGHSNSICQGEASGLIALIEAATVIQRGACDAVVAGGTGSLMELTSVLYRKGKQLSQRIDDPTKASRPFDLDRDGMVVGEGAGAIVLESAEHAARRGAQPLAKIRGWSRGFKNIDDPGFASALQGGFEASLAAANVKSTEIDFVNANACGTLLGDAWEANAIRNVFADTPVVANKGNFGNLGPGTSTVELVGSVLSLNSRTLPPTINLETDDPNCPVNASQNSVPLSQLGTTKTLKSSISSTGQFASIILESV
jgi:3-oxoacyl-[acyl-carrier-protein] synthase II